MSHRQHEYDHLLKFLIVSNSGAGKSLLRDTFTGESYDVSTDPGFRKHMVELNGKRIRFHVYEDENRRRFRKLTNPEKQYRGASGILLMYDITDADALVNVEELYRQEVLYYAREGLPIILVGAKSDLTDQRKISFEQGKALADRLGIPFIEVSSKSNRNVEEAFLIPARMALKEMGVIQEEAEVKTQAASVMPSAESIGIMTRIRQGLVNIVSGLWSGLKSFGRGIVNFVWRTSPSEVQPPPVSSNAPPAVESKLPPIRVRSSELEDRQRRAGMRLSSDQRNIQGENKVAERDNLAQAVQPNNLVRGAAVPTQEELKLQQENAALKARLRDMESAQARREGNDAFLPPPPPYESPEEIELKTIRSTLLSDQSGLFLEPACEDTETARQFLEKVCLAIATTQDEKQCSNCTENLAKKVNENGILKSNLETLAHQMKIQQASSSPMEFGQDNAVSDAMVRRDHIYDAVTKTLARAETLKRTLRR